MCVCGVFSSEYAYMLNVCTNYSIAEWPTAYFFFGKFS